MNDVKNFNRMKKAVRAIRVLITVCFWASLAAAVITALTGLSLYLVPVSLFEKSNLGLLFRSGVPGSGFFKMNAGNILVYLPNAGPARIVDLLPVFKTILLRVTLCEMLIAPFFLQLSRILKDAEAGRPFSPANAGRLSVMGVLIIVFSAVSSIGEYIMLSTVFSIVNTPDISANFRMDAGGILIGILLILLAGIFRYGGYLQQEYDATL